MTEEQAAAAIDIAKSQLTTEYGNVHDAVLDVGLGGPFRVYSPEEQLLNVHTVELRLGEIPKPPKAPTKKEVTKGSVDGLIRYMSESQGVPKRGITNEIKFDYENVYRDYQKTLTETPPWEDLPTFLSFISGRGNVDGQFGRMIQELTTRTGKPLTKTQLKRIQKELGLGPDPSGDQFVDSLNKATSKKGRILARDLYDQMKTAGDFEGSLGDFRKKVSDLRKAGTISMSGYEKPLPNQAKAIKPVATEEGNFGSDFRRDIGYGNETYRNRIIDSEFVVKARTKYTSPVRAHYIDPPKGFEPEAGSIERSGRIGRSPQANPKNDEELMTALNALQERLVKTDDSALYDRIGKFRDRIEKRYGAERFSEYSSEVDPASTGSPYGVIPSRSDAVEVSKGGLSKKAKKEDKQRRALDNLAKQVTQDKGYYNLKEFDDELVKSSKTISKELDEYRQKSNLEVDDLEEELFKADRSDEYILTFLVNDKNAESFGPNPILDMLRAIKEKTGKLTEGQTKKVLDYAKNPGNDGGSRRFAAVGQQPDLEFVGRDFSKREIKAADSRISAQNKNLFEDLERRTWALLNKLQDNNKVAIDIKVGKPSASLFSKRDQAAFYGKNVYGLSPNQFRIRQQGNGYYISIPKIVDETFDAARDLQVTTTNRPSDSGFSAVLGSVIAPDNYVDELSNFNRAVVTYLPQEMHRLVQDAAKGILEIPRHEREELRAIFTANRDFKFIDDEGKLRRGRFNQTHGDFEREFYQRYKKLPTEGQTNAYFDYVRYYNLDLAFRDLAFTRDMGRVGLERTTVGFHAVDADGISVRHQSKPFSSREIDKLPYEDPENWGLWIYNPVAKKDEFYLRSTVTDEVKKDIDDKVANHGFKILEVGNPLEKPVLGFAKTDEIINFIVVKDYDKSKYNFSNIPARPGGHVAYQDEVFIKQPRMRKTDRGWVYEGDETLLNVTTEAAAKKMYKAIDKGRELLRAGKLDDLDRHLGKNTPYTREEFESLFNERRLPNGDIEPPRFSLDHEFGYTTKGRNVFDMSAFKRRADGYENFQNAIRSKFNLFANYVDKKYLGSRDPDVPALLETMSRVDGKMQPQMTLTAPRLIDPYEVINSSLANVIRSRYLNDAKIQAAEHFIEAFADVMKASREEMRRNPMYYLHNPGFDTSTDNYKMLTIGMHYRQAALNLIGTDTLLGRSMNWLYTQMTDGLYTVKGQPSADSFTSTFRNWSNPVDFLRRMTFHTKLGMGNVVQAWKQSGAITYMAGQEGWAPVLASIPDAFAARWLALTEDPEKIESVIKVLKATWGNKFKFDDVTFREAFEELKKTGMYNVGGEHASRDDFFDPKVFTSQGEKWLDKSAIFFTEGERFQRLVAWFTKYKQWRQLNPKAVMTNAERARVTEQTHFLTNRMARNSNANIQSGSAAVTFQFLSYQWRMAEALLGNRLTKAQKARVFLTHAALYGVPVATSGFTVVGFYDEIRQYMLEEGYDMTDPAIQSMHEGIVSMLLTAITGEEYNIPTSYGPAGLTSVKELFSEDGSWLKFLMGASGSVTGDIISSSHAAYDFVMSFANPNHESPTLADFEEVTKNISSVNIALRSYMMYNAQQYVTKNENVILDDTTATDAAMHLIFGLTPNKVGDTFKMLESVKQEEQTQRAAERIAIKYLKRYMTARVDGDLLLAGKNLRIAKAALIGGGVRPNEWSRVLQRAYKGNEPLYERALKDFVKKSPPAQQPARKTRAVEELNLGTP